MVESFPTHSLHVVLTVQPLVRSKSTLNEAIVDCVVISRVGRGEGAVWGPLFAD